MDPISVIILSGIFATLFARTVGNAVTDGIAQSKGKTPPSLEKWRKREAERVAAGEKPRSEPGPVGRWWHNAVEAHTAKAAQKHVARMELLRDNAPELTAAHKEKLRKRAARWDKINRTVAGTGGAYWDVAKLAAEQAKEALDERHAWKENERRSAEAEQDQGDATDPDQASGSDPSNKSDGDKPDSEAGADGRCVPEWDEHANYTDTGQRGVNPLTGNTYEVWRCQCGAKTLELFPDDPSAKVLPFRRPDQPIDTQSGADGDTPISSVVHTHTRMWRVTCSLCPDGVDGYYRTPEECRDAAQRHKEMHDRKDRGDLDASSDVEASDAAPTDRLDSTNEGNPLVSTPNTTTEITDLDTALSYSQETAKYVDTVSATLSDMLAQLTAAEQGLAAEAAAYEQAKASLQDEGFGSKVTGKFDVAAEALHAAADALKAAAFQVTAAAEQASTAGGEMRGAVAVFSDQLAVSETVGAAQQDAGVSKRTNFYAPA